MTVRNPFPTVLQRRRPAVEGSDGVPLPDQLSSRLMSFISRLWREDAEQLSATYKKEENFKTTMPSSESMEATFFLNHISTLWTYKLYERLRLCTSLDKYAASQSCGMWEPQMQDHNGSWNPSRRCRESPSWPSDSSLRQRLAKAIHSLNTKSYN